MVIDNHYAAFTNPEGKIGTLGLKGLCAVALRNSLLEFKLLSQPYILNPKP